MIVQNREVTSTNLLEYREAQTSDNVSSLSPTNSTFIETEIFSYKKRIRQS